MICVLGCGIGLEFGAVMYPLAVIGVDPGVKRVKRSDRGKQVNGDRVDVVLSLEEWNVWRMRE